MDKVYADRIIEKYFYKIYGFAVKKSYSSEETDDLCAEMVKEVYLSLLNADEIINAEGYIWRICMNTYAKYVSERRKNKGVSIEGMEFPYYDEYDLGEAQEELKTLRREVAFLTKTRRRIIYSFYYEGKSIKKISKETALPEGTVKWHLNKSRIELKEGFKMERKIGKLGLAPIEAMDFGHNGSVGEDGGPETYLGDKLNLNIVYSVYDAPKTADEIAAELGMTPVFLEDRISYLEENGFLVRTSGRRYTTYVWFTPREISVEANEKILKDKIQAVEELMNQYVPKVREAIADFGDVYIPSGNRELFEAAVIFYAISEKCCIPIVKSLSKYRIRTLDGGDYAYVKVSLKPEIQDADYKLQLPESSKDYSCCGAMIRGSSKYPTVCSWSNDSRFCSRKGYWENNLMTDYEWLYEFMTGAIRDTKANAEKYNRLREREFITYDDRVSIMVVKANAQEFFGKIPEPDKALIAGFADSALEQASRIAKHYPPQMQDLVIFDFVHNYFGNTAAMMIMDELYDSGVFKLLTKQEKVTSQLLMFCDALPMSR